MADPLSITASVIAVGGLAVRVAQATKRLSNASNEVAALQNEVSDIQATVKQLEDLCDKPWPDASQGQLNDLHEVLDKILKPGLQRIENLINKHLSSNVSDIHRRAAWLLFERKIGNERNALRATKSSLVGIFNLLSHATTRRLGFQVGGIELSVSQLQAGIASNQAQLDALQRLITSQHAEVVANLERDPVAGISNSLSSSSLSTASNSAAANPLGALALPSHRHAVGQANSTFIVDPAAGAQARQEVTLSLDGVKYEWSPRCYCACHEKPWHIATPGFASNVIGQVLIGFNIKAWTIRKCTDSECKRRSKKVIRIQYRFPAWFLAAQLSVLASFSESQTPELLLRVPRVRHYQDPIFDAVVRGDIPSVQALFAARGASIHDVEDVGGHSLLHRALSAKRPAMIEFLLNHGADISVVNAKKNSCGDIFWTIVLSKGMPQRSYQPLLTRFESSTYREDGNFSMVHRAVLYPERNSLEELLRLAPSSIIDQKDAYGRTPLAWASARADVDMVRLLLSRNADPNIVEIGGWGPLHNAMLTDNTEVPRLLLEAGADPNIGSNVFADTPLHICCRDESLRIHIPLLLEHDADASLRSRIHDSPLALAGKRNHPKTVALLLSHTPRSKHTRAFVDALKAGSIESLSAFLEHDADLSSIDGDGLSVLEHIAECSSISALRSLLDCGAFWSTNRSATSGSRLGEIVDTRSDEWKAVWERLLAQRTNNDIDEEDVFHDCE